MRRRKRNRSRRIQLFRMRYIKVTGKKILVIIRKKTSVSEFWVCAREEF